MENEIKELETRISKIEERNRRVELDKAWETSNFRKALVAVLTYLVISIFFIVIKVDKPFINAIVPTLGFLLSTLSLSAIKRVWLSNKSKR